MLTYGQVIRLVLKAETVQKSKPYIQQPFSANNVSSPVTDYFKDAVFDQIVEPKEIDHKTEAEKTVEVVKQRAKEELKLSQSRNAVTMTKVLMEFTEELNGLGNDNQVNSAVIELKETAKKNIETIEKNELKMIELTIPNIRVNDNIEKIFTWLLDSMSTSRAVHSAVTAIKMKLAELTDYNADHPLYKNHLHFIDNSARVKLRALKFLNNANKPEPSFNDLMENNSSEQKTESIPPSLLENYWDQEFSEPNVVVEESKDDLHYSQVDSPGNLEPLRMELAPTRVNSMDITHLLKGLYQRVLAKKRSILCKLVYTS